MLQQKDVRCKKCNSTLNYIRFKDSMRICRKCGFSEKIKIEEMKGGK